jgi:beta-lactamase class A
VTVSRRQLLAGGGALMAAACVPLDRAPDGRLAAKLRLIEVGVGGELGVAFLDPAGNLSLGYRQDERFAMCSTFKTSLAALVLRLDQTGALDAGETIRWQAGDLLDYAPFARERLAAGATLREMARAAQVLSDNTAANLLLARVGGPAGLTAFWRSLGDTVSRLDRTEPRLNYVPPGELRDTTAPAAMAATIARLLSGRVLDDERTALLRQWMVETRTGAARVRAGLPGDWIAGDKTGTSGAWPNMGQARGDIGFAVGPAGDPVTFAVYHRASPTGTATAEQVDAAFAEVGRTLAAWIRRNHAIVVT